MSEPHTAAVERPSGANAPVAWRARADLTERDHYVLSCRIYRTNSGITGEPDEQWLREALSAAG